MLTRALDEPLAGTAPVATRWVLLEHRGAWPRDVGRHPDPAIAAFADRAAAAGLRLLLIRRPGRRDGDGPGRLFLADTIPGTTRTTVCTVTGPAELADVPLPAPGDPLPGLPVHDPLLLVCTHGRRDRCCALEGRALALAVTGAGQPDVWECSHLGGHRFAPTALVLPTGYLYGRLDAAAAIAAHKAAGHAEVETSLCRGRSTWSAAGQVAELAVRAATGAAGGRRPGRHRRSRRRGRHRTRRAVLGRRGARGDRATAAGVVRRGPPPRHPAASRGRAAAVTRSSWDPQRLGPQLLGPAAPVTRSPCDPALQRIVVIASLAARSSSRPANPARVSVMSSSASTERTTWRTPSWPPSARP